MCNIKYYIISLFYNFICKPIKKRKHLKAQLEQEKIIRETNKIILVKQNGEKITNPIINKLKVNFVGRDNYLEIHEPFSISQLLCVNFDSSNANVILKKNFKIDNLKLNVGLNSKVEIGENFSCADVFIISRRTKNSTIKIGNNCMFSGEIQIRNTDSHVIYDKTTKEILNYDKDVKIADNVWLGYRTVVLKGTKIPQGCVVGACSLVNKEFKKENCIIAGIPAKIIKENIVWNSSEIYKWEESMQLNHQEFE